MFIMSVVISALSSLMSAFLPLVGHPLKGGGQPLVLVLLLLASAVHLLSGLSIRSSCDYSNSSAWDRREVGAGLRTWLASLTSVPGEGPITSYLYDRETGQHYIHYVGRNDHPVQQADTADRSVVTVVRAALAGLPALAWQWVSRYKLDGIVYGEPDAEGRLTGPNITFIYPDFETGLRGTFEDGRLVAGLAVRITGRRCRGGLMEIRTRPSRSATAGDPLRPWRRETFPGEHVRANARRMDPFERRAVYAAPSLIPGANEGVFAKRDFLPGQLVSYFVGLLTIEANFLFDNLTASEYDEARAYYFNLGSHSPNVWGLSKDIVLDIPVDLRTVEAFRTTLAHKTNHKFEGNTEFDVIFHPVYGPAACILAKLHIRRGEELYVSYNYRIAWAPAWYQDAYRQYQQARGDQQDELGVIEEEEEEWEQLTQDDGGEDEVQE